MNEPLTEEKKAQKVESELTKKVNKRYAAFAKYHPGVFEFRDFLVAAIRKRIEEGGNYPDDPLKEMVAEERKRRELIKKAEQTIRSEQAQIDPVYKGMVVGMMIAGAKSPELKGLVAGLAGLKDEEGQQPS
jgi:hypothetical protein